MTEKRWCAKCLNQSWCRYINPYIGFYCPGYEDKIDNKSPRREELVTDVIAGTDIEARDYKDVLIEVQDNKADEHALMHDRIMAMPDDQLVDLLKKAVAALAFFEVSAGKSIRVLKLAERTFYRYFRGK